MQALADKDRTGADRLGADRPGGDRIDWLDTLRAIAIAFVVLGHTPGLDGLLRKLIFAFHMPVFFWISGVFAKDRIRETPFSAFAADRARKRLVPYAVFSAVSYLFWLLALRHFGTRAGLGINPLRPLAGIFYGNGINHWLEHNTVLWFFLCLLVTELMFFGIIRAGGRVRMMGVLAFFSAAGYLDVQLNPPDGLRLPWNADIALTAVVFYGAGYLLRDIVSGLSRWCPGLRALAMAACALAWIGPALANREVAMVAGVYGSYLLFYPAAFGGIFFWALLAASLPPYRWLGAAGRDSLVIFSLHLMVFPFITGIYIYILGLPQALRHESLLVSLVYTAASIAVLMPVSRLMRRHAPFLLGEPGRSRQRENKHPG